MITAEINNTAALAERNAVLNATDYEKDGILFCGICNTAKQIKISFAGMQRTVFCDCKCQSEEYNKVCEQLKKEKIDTARTEYLPLHEMHSWRFENADNSNKSKMDIAKKYVCNWNTMYKDNIGLMLFGDVGTGKTYISACIANALIDLGEKVLFTDFSTIINNMMDFSTGNNNDYLNSLQKYSLLIIDDLGVERTTDTALQYVEDVINSRYKTKMPIIVTTNKTVTETKSETKIKFQRIYSRILGMTVPLEVSGGDKRKTEQSIKMQTAKNLLLGGQHDN